METAWSKVDLKRMIFSEDSEICNLTWTNLQKSAECFLSVNFVIISLILNKTATYNKGFGGWLNKHSTWQSLQATGQTRKVVAKSNYYLTDIWSPVWNASCLLLVGLGFFGFLVFF